MTTEITIYDKRVHNNQTRDFGSIVGDISSIFSGKTTTQPTVTTQTKEMANTGLIVGVGIVLVAFMFVVFKFM